MVAALVAVSGAAASVIRCRRGYQRWQRRKPWAASIRSKPLVELLPWRWTMRAEAPETDIYPFPIGVHGLFRRRHLHSKLH